MANLTNTKIKDTYQYLLQLDSATGKIQDGLGNDNITLDFTSASVLGLSSSYATTASYAVSASFEITKEVSSSYAETASVLAASGSTPAVITGSLTHVGSSVISGSLEVTGSITGSLFGTASHLDWTDNAYELHVSADNGDDNNSGSLLYPYKTINAAVSASDSSGRKIVVHRGVYNEDITISNPNITLTSADGQGGSLVTLSGALIVSSSTSSTRLNGIRINHLTHQGAGDLYIYDCLVPNSASFEGSGYVEMHRSDLETSGTISVTGSSTIVTLNSKVYPIVQNNASSIVYLKNNTTVFSPTVTAGTLAIIDSVVYPTTPTSASITSSPGTVVQLLNTQVAEVNGTPAKINIGGFLGYDDITFEPSGSNLGTSLGVKSYFQTASADYFTGSFEGTVVGLVYTESFTSASQYWEVSHSLDIDFPNVMVWESRSVVQPDEIYSVDENILHISFSVPTSGIVRVQ